MATTCVHCCQTTLLGSCACNSQGATICDATPCLCSSSLNASYLGL